MQAPLEAVSVAHARSLQAAERIAQRIGEETGFPQESIPVTETGAVLSSHGGPGVIGVIVLSKPQ